MAVVITVHDPNLWFPKQTQRYARSRKVNINSGAMYDKAFDGFDTDLQGFADFEANRFYCKEAGIYGVQTIDKLYHNGKNNNGKDLDATLDFRKDDVVSNILAEYDNEKNSGIEQKHNTKTNWDAVLKTLSIGENPDDSSNHATNCPYQFTTKITSQSKSSSSVKRFNESKAILSETYESKQQFNEDICATLDCGKNGPTGNNKKSHSTISSDEIRINRERAKTGKREVQSMKRELLGNEKMECKNLALKETVSIEEEKSGSKAILVEKESISGNGSNDIFQRLDLCDGFPLHVACRNKHDYIIAFKNTEDLKNQPGRISEKWKTSAVLPKAQNDTPTEKMFFTTFTGILFNIKETNITTMEDSRDAILHNYSTSHEERNSILTQRTYEFFVSRLVENRLMYPTEDGYRVISSRRPKTKRNKYLCFGYQPLDLDENNNSEDNQKSKKHREKPRAKTELNDRQNVKSKGKSTKSAKRKSRNFFAGYVFMQVVVKLTKTIILL